MPELLPSFAPLEVEHVFENTGMLVAMNDIPGALDGTATDGLVPMSGVFVRRPHGSSMRTPSAFTMSQECSPVTGR